MPIKKGQRVVMFYRSANFDQDVFDDPYTFNIPVIPTGTSVLAGPARTTASVRTWPG